VSPTHRRVSLFRAAYAHRGGSTAARGRVGTRPYTLFTALNPSESLGNANEHSLQSSYPAGLATLA
jgi:hypothetical protein